MNTYEGTRPYSIVLGRQSLTHTRTKDGNVRLYYSTLDAAAKDAARLLNIFSGIVTLSAPFDPTIRDICEAEGEGTDQHLRVRARREKSNRTIYEAVGEDGLVLSTGIIYDEECDEELLVPVDFHQRRDGSGKVYEVDVPIERDEVLESAATIRFGEHPTLDVPMLHPEDRSFTKETVIGLYGQAFTAACNLFC